MSAKERYFDPIWYYYKVIILCIFIFVDIIMSSFTQYLNFGSVANIQNSTVCTANNVELCYAFIFLQLGVQILMIFTILSIFSHTFLFKQGILGEICKQFVLTFITMFLYPIVSLAERFIRSVSNSFFKFFNIMKLDLSIRAFK